MRAGDRQELGSERHILPFLQWKSGGSVAGRHRLDDGLLLERTVEKRVGPVVRALHAGC